MGSIAKAVKRVIPKEIQPILPIAASMFGGPMIGSALGLGAKTGILSGITSPILQRAIGSGITSAGVDLLTSGKIDPKTLATSTLFGAGGQYFKDVGAGNRGIMGLDLTEKAREQFSNIGNLIAPTGVDPETGKFDLSGDIIKSGSTALTAGSSISAYNAAEEAQREYDEMMAGREADSAANRQSRIDYITRYMGLAGFSQSEIDEALSNAGYQNGGRVGYLIGGGPVKSFFAKLLNAEPSEEVMQRMVEERKKEILNEMFDPEAETGAYSMQQMQEANEMATKQAMKELEEFKMRIGMDLGDPPEGSVADDMIDQIMEPRKKEEFLPTAPPRDMRNEEREFLPTALPRDMRKDGGIMNLNMGGMPAEMDLRGGGFVPLGAKEKADDVPARLSKNEFVMTADAVRAAGGGSVNKGAKRMYDLMNSLEARV
jgi:hypothetical protein